ncbi:LytR/AlgR family response regulator transcription factor [Tunturiibacter lichenicola]|uniref:LytR/AlgR family response regulator transcription factor n=1 Tax=Tunturiibacter lichenicola TaxID=2051959 RepID=UPI0021B3AA93|nr:LytTR family DNA-binding domain-containing protein [Edaphobacter lichenicola]
MHSKELPERVRTLVVDDEPLARSNLMVLLGLHPEIEIVRECGSGAEALSAVRELKPDLVFLDVEMPECDGFDVLEMLGRDLPLAVVFVTAYDKYALRAFDAGALDYLLKPFDNARFERALDRAKEKIAQGRSSPQARELLVVKSAGQVSFLKISEIDWIEAADYYSCLHVGTKSHLVRRSMAELDQELDQSVFCRIHRSTIVQLDRVRGLKLNESGEYDVVLNDGTRLRLSRRYRAQVQSRLGLAGSWQES